jgi:hypothetical protein
MRRQEKRGQKCGLHPLNTFLGTLFLNEPPYNANSSRGFVLLIQHSVDLVDLLVELELFWAFVSFVARVCANVDGKTHTAIVNASVLLQSF